MYGLTETYGPTTVCAWQDGWPQMETDVLAPRLARQGQAYVISDEVRVVDPDMRDVPRDGATMGEVVMRGNNVMLGHFRSDEASEEGSDWEGTWSKLRSGAAHAFLQLAHVVRRLEASGTSSSPANS